MKFIKGFIVVGWTFLILAAILSGCSGLDLGTVGKVALGVAAGGAILVFHKVVTAVVLTLMTVACFIVSAYLAKQWTDLARKTLENRSVGSWVVLSLDFAYTAPISLYIGLLGHKLSGPAFLALDALSKG